MNEELGNINESFRRALCELIEVCEEQRINIHTLYKVVANKKVAPMIRGVGNEYDVFDLLRLQGIGVRKDEEKDTDLYIMLKNRTELKGEVKQGKKDSLRITSEGVYVKIKCMRSRTSGEKRSKQRAAILNIDPALYKVHSDQYRTTNFDIVLANIENTYINLELDDAEREFLELIGADKDRKAVWYWASSKDLISTSKHRCCQRRNCDKNCGFIPHYPEIFFKKGTVNPELPWKRVFAKRPIT